MPTTSDGRTVYTDPSRVERYVQTSPDVFSLSTTETPSEWQEFLEDLQAQAKGRIDSFCDRDFEHHQGETVSISREIGNNAFYVPNPVFSVSSVAVNGTEIDAEQYRIKDAGMITFPNREYIARFIGLEGNDGLNEEPNHAYGEYGDDVYAYEDIITVTLDYGYTSPPEHIKSAELQLVQNTVRGLADSREEAIIEQEDATTQSALANAMTSEIRNLLTREKDMEMFI